MIQSAYLDHNATSPPRPDAIAAAVAALALPGNASSAHGFGRASRRVIEEAREAVAALIGADPTLVVFTSGGSESNALAVRGFNRTRLLVSAVEHASLRTIPGAEMVRVDQHGIIDLAALETLLTADSRPALVALMLANNETGVIQPVAEAVRIAHAHGALLHCDAVQAAGKIAVDFMALGVDSLAVSAHKLGGIQGVGALILASPVLAFEPMIRGGGQEGGRRAGTENLAGIAGFGAAALIVWEQMGEEAARELALRDRLEAAIRAEVPGIRVMGGEVARLPNTSCLALPGLAARKAVIALDLAGIAVSAGAACAAGRAEDSPVLKAMGETSLAGSALRVSLGWNSVEQDIERFLAAFAALAGRLVPDDINRAA